jgi:hypothetical protein
VHQATGVGGPDVHTGTLANRLETLEDGQVASGVRLGRCGHGDSVDEVTDNLGEALPTSDVTAV